MRAPSRRKEGIIVDDPSSVEKEKERMSSFYSFDDQLRCNFNLTINTRSLFFLSQSWEKSQGYLVDGMKGLPPESLCCTMLYSGVVVPWHVQDSKSHTIRR